MADNKIQGELIDLAGRMAWHIKQDRPPKELAMNQKDIISLYPEVNTDFVYVSGEEKEKVIEACRVYRHATKQEKLWKDRKAEASDTLAVYLKDRKEMRDEDGVLARWTERKGYERVTPLGKIEKDDPVSYRYLKRKKLVEKTDATRFPSVVWKEDVGKNGNE